MIFPPEESSVILVLYAGVYEKLPYIKDLGVGAIWFSPIFKSPMVDFGYDIANYREIDPIFGKMEDFEAVLKRAKELGESAVADFKFIQSNACVIKTLNL